MSTKVMTAKLKFGAFKNRSAFEVRKISAVEIDSGWKLLTDTAVITLPRNVRDFEKQNVRDVFRRGTPVEIYLGYDNNNILEFKGYVTEISADIPIKIKCEDEMWKVKQIPVNYSAQNATLASLLTAIFPDYEIDALEGVQLGAIRFSRTTAGKVLEKLQQEWNLYTYMKGNQIVCGKYYADDSDLEPVNFHLEKNCIENNLQYQRAEDIHLKVRAVSTLKNGKKIEVVVGNEDGEERQLSYYNISVEAELKKLAELDYNKSKQDGFDGSFTAFGTPSVQHGQKVNLTSKLYEDRNGMYYIESVGKKFSKDGYRQEIKTGNRA